VKFRGRPAARVLPAAAIALLVLSGCGELTPGTASDVNGTQITTDEVQELAGAQCVLRKQLTKDGQAPASSASRIRQESLELLMDTELSKQFGKSEGYEVNKPLANALFGQVSPLFEPLPEKPRTILSDVFRQWSEGRTLLVLAGAKATGQQPTPQNLDQMMNAGAQVRATWLKKADITTDPSYAPDKNGFPGGASSSSVSRAASDFAKGSTAAEQDQKWVSALPAKQKCG
jgi:hypothetical protein